MGLSLLLAVDENRDTLAAVESQLARRYARDYRVECLADPAQAMRLLTELAHSGEDVTLVLARNAPGRTTGFELFDHVRQLHPHAKRALLVPPDTWSDAATAEAIRVSLTLGRIHYYVPSPAASLDEEFHESVSGFLLEWARDRGLAPQTIHVVGKTWSGRAYELRKTLEQCSVPHTFCLADSDPGRRLLAGAGADPKLPLMVLPDGRVLNDPSNAELVGTGYSHSIISRPRNPLFLLPLYTSLRVNAVRDPVETLGWRASELAFVSQSAYPSLQHRFAGCSGARISH
jgi:thioredoxin reductase (NADPH)